MGEKLVLLMILIAVTAVLVVAPNSRITSASPYVNVDVETAYNMITNGSYPGLVILDVRTKSEYDSGHIYNAVWIPHSELETRIGELAGHEDDEIIVYCLSGGRSATASGILDSYNFTKIYNMLGGFSAWQTKGYPTWTATVHNLNTTINYDIIQAAIEAPQTLDGHTIFVEEGTYYENVVVDKTLILLGENKENTIIDANGTGTVVVIEADNVTFKDFMVQYGGLGVVIMGNETKRYVGNNVSENVFRNNAEAVMFINSDSNFVVNNSLHNNGFGIQLGLVIPYIGSYSSNNNMIIGNTITSSGRGIWVHNSSHNIISQNTITNIIGEGIIAETPYVPWAPRPPVFSNNTISYNVITNCTIGLSVAYGPRGVSSYSGGNNITGNIVQFNELGVYICDWGSNTIVNNTIKNNVFGMFLLSENNKLRANVMFENMYNFVEIKLSYNDIDASNTVNGKSIHHLFNQTNLNINPSTYPDMGFLTLKNCSNVIIENMTFSNNGFGMALEECTNITIAGTTIQDNIIGISALRMDNVCIRNNTIKNNLHGVSVISGEYVTFENNLIVNNTNRRILQTMNFHSLQAMPPWVRGIIYDFRLGIAISLGHTALFAAGIRLFGVENSTVIGNMIANNERGIHLTKSIHNVFRNNTMTNNVYNFGVDPYWMFPSEWGFDPPEPPQISPFLMNDVDTSNTVDGKPIYWWMNRHEEEIPEDAGYVVLINSTDVVIRDLVLQNNSQGMLLVGVSNSSIINNVIANSQYGILIRPHVYVNPSTGNIVAQNNVTRSGVGIEAYSPNTVISHNFLTNNLAGMYIRDNVTIADNMVVNSTNPPLDEWVFGYPLHAIGTREWFYYGKGGVGLILEGTNITVQSNKIQDNYYGISVGYRWGEGGNKIYHNNFINNTEHVWRGLPGQPPTPMRNNTWDHGYPSSGNYWSNYNGTDSGGDGLGDTPYQIDTNNTDNYPLVGIFSSFNTVLAKRVNVVSNSTIEDFEYFESNSTIRMFVSNMTSNQTCGFCRVAIPHTFMNVTNIEVIIDNGTTPLLYHNYTLYDNDTHRWIYFSYPHSIHEIDIIPEFPSLLILPLFMIATLVTAIIYRRKHTSDHFLF